MGSNLPLHFSVKFLIIYTHLFLTFYLLTIKWNPWLFLLIIFYATHSLEPASEPQPYGYICHFLSWFLLLGWDFKTLPLLTEQCLLIGMNLFDVKTFAWEPSYFYFLKIDHFPVLNLLKSLTLGPYRYLLQSDTVPGNHTLLSFVWLYFLH